LSTVNGLSEIGISCIEANNSHQSLLIAYNSSNLDLIKNGCGFNGLRVGSNYTSGTIEHIHNIMNDEYIN